MTDFKSVTIALVNKPEKIMTHLEQTRPYSLECLEERLCGVYFSTIHD